MNAKPLAFVFDPNVLVVETIDMALEQLGYRTCSTHCIDKAEALFASDECPALIVSHVRFDVNDSDEEALRNALRADNSIPIVMISSDFPGGDAPVPDAVMLFKPFDMRTFARAVSDARLVKAANCTLTAIWQKSSDSFHAAM